MADPDNPSELTGQEVGLFAVHTERSVHYFDLHGNGRGTVTREPGPGAERSVLDVHHQLQGPQGRATVKERSVYTIVSCLPIESDGRPRYRIKSKSENVERVVTEEQISRLG